ncbi:hypothetical protein [Thiorhodovibrio frisius]|uniref:Uncharacterized protein n=1 Tax=Thiorhodovibrio frisius TaxID=631362 RepID=H8YWD1_9GAMM|nr:hypothetical protein [Thiorhodovibrio frisius]EIC23734.1 hypothetical protein Thi970DRAFT_00239 [Thiorhodovibrio frisius]WPL20154.1 hypothetical protein Thiofri_00216 [Thiorhodovibrio frisius]
MTLKPARTPWRDFPPVVIHSPEIAVKRHPDYRAAKSGDVQAAFSLVKATIGGVVIGATVLTGKPFSAVLSPTQEQLTALRAKHGQTLEIWWHERFGYGFDCLTQSEARYLERSPDADTIRSRLIEEE